MKLPDRFPFQTRSTRWVIEHPKGILGLDTGLGKSRICTDAVHVLHKQKEVKRLLIISPASLRINWERELTLWWPSYSKLLPVRVVSYEYCLQKENVADLLRGQYDMCICDEAHFLRNWSAQRTRNIMKDILRGKNRIVFSTATPVVRSAEDLHPMMSRIEPGKWKTFLEYQERYCEKIYDEGAPTGWKYGGVRKDHAAELKARVAPHIIRIKKASVLKDLPEKIVQVIEIEVAQKHNRIDKQFDAERLREVLERGSVEAEQPDENLSLARRALGLAKVPHVVDFLSSVNFRDQQVVIFAHHRQVVQKLHDAIIKEFQITCDFILGGMAEKKMTAIKDSFQSGEVRCLICSIDAMAYGHNLTAASICVFAELPWTYTQLKQCGDRVHRLGLKHGLNEYRLHAVGTMDDLIMRAINKKISTSELTVGHMV